MNIQKHIKTQITAAVRLSKAIEAGLWLECFQPTKPQFLTLIHKAYCFPFVSSTLPSMGQKYRWYFKKLIQNCN